MSNAKEAAAAAAKWWGDRLQRPRFDSGDPSDAGGMAMCMASILAARNGITEEDVTRFVAALTERVSAVLEAEGPNEIPWPDAIYCGKGGGPQLVLRVDYHPTTALCEAVQEAIGPDRKFDTMSILPWKTTMWVTRHHVEVRGGYGAANEILWGDVEAAHPGRAAENARFAAECAAEDRARAAATK